MTGFGLFALGHYANRREPSVHHLRRRGLSDLININTAGHEDFRDRFGLERELVEKIIENRPYVSKIDLLERRILPNDTYEAIEFDITVHEVA
jgi:DNA uptake protein ComE-like DNA-binding protein